MTNELKTPSPSMPLSFPDAIKWSVKGKVITVTIKLRFYSDVGPPPDLGYVIYIVTAIEKIWHGYKYKCYDFVVKVDAEAAAKTAIPADALDVELINDLSVADTGTAWAKDPTKPLNPLSDDPSQLIRPVSSVGMPVANRTTWPLAAPMNVYAHEVGHMLGLDQGATATGDPKAPSKLIPGHSNDLMANGNSVVVSPQTITRVIRRNRDRILAQTNFDVSQIKCPIRIEADPMRVNLVLASLTDFAFYAYVCDYDPPSDDPAQQPKPMEFQGTWTTKGEYLKQLLPKVGAKGAVKLPIKFSLRIAPTAEAVMPRDPYGLYIELTNKLHLSGKCLWNVKTGLPLLMGELEVNGTRLSAFLGTGLYAYFSHGAKECEKK